MTSYRRLGVLVAALAMVPLAIGQSGYLMRLAVLAAVFALFAVALNLVFGHTDQLFLFVGGIAGIGAYTTLLTADALGLPPVVTLPLGMAVCGLITGLVSYVSARRDFSVIVIAILTLNLQLAFTEIFVGASDITGGSTGFIYESYIPTSFEETFVALTLEPSVALYYIVVVVLTIVLVGYVWVINSRHGIALDAIRDDETAAEATGIDVVRYKTAIGAVGGAIIGAGGVLYVERGLSTVTPSLFGFLTVDVVVLIMLVAGGLRTMAGPVVGAFLIIGLEELLGMLNEALTAAQVPIIAQFEIETTMFGLLLIGIFLYFRQGIVPALEEQLTDRDLPVVGDTAAEESTPEVESTPETDTDPETDQTD